MGKSLSKIFKYTGITLVALLLILILIPFIFGDQIKTAVKDYINEEVNATVYFEDVGIGVFSNFPNLTVTLDKFGVLNKAPFEGDTLIDVEHFGVVVNLFSLFGDQYEVNKITLDEPYIHARVNKAGVANWDIMKASDAPAEAEVVEVDTSSASSLALSLNKYAISKGHVIYDDRSSDMYAEVYNLDHKGSGNFVGDQYDVDTYTHAEQVTFRMEGDNYLSKAKIDADLTVNIDNANSTYTLKENRVGLNELDLHFDGWVALKGDDVKMDLKLGTNQNSFSSILSMVPGMYTQDFGDIETDGTFKLDGWAKGTYNENSLPGFNMHLAVDNGTFHYPDLPSRIKDINFDVKVDCPSGDLNKLGINMPNFHALFGQNPIDARCVLSGLMTESYNIDATAKANLDLAELLTMFPMEGHELKGKFMIDGTAKGVYNEAAGKMPVVNAKMNLADGYYKTADFPSALSNMSMDGSMSSNGDLAASSLTVTQFHTEIDGDPIDAQLAVNNFDDPAYDLSAKGRLSLDKLNKILELEDTEMAGLLDMDLTTKGRLSAIEQERYLDLPTQGNVELTGFSYKSVDLPQGMKISRGKVSFDPQKLSIDQFNGQLGASPVSMTGYIDNYLAYAMLPDQNLTGRIELSSQRFNVNEWMVEEPVSEAQAEANEAPEEEVPMTAFEVPLGIDFIFNCNIDRVIYDNLNLDNLQGRVIMRDQKVTFEQLKFNTLGGNMRMSGSYATPDPTNPDVDLKMTLVNLDIGKTWKAVELVKTLAPVGKFMQGKINSSFDLKGKLTSEMFPNLATITSVGDLNILQGKLAGFKAMDMVADKLKLNKLKTLDVKDTKMLYEVKDGRVWVEPFDVPIGGGKMNVDGSHGLDQAMDYALDFDVPAGAAGAAAMQAVGNLIGKPAGDRFKAKVGLGGSVDNPKIKYVRSDGVESIKEEVMEKVDEVKEEVVEKVEEVKEEVKEKVDDAKEKAKAEAAKIVQEAENKAAQIRSEAKKQAQRLRDEANKAADDIEKSAKNPLEKIAKRKLADQTRKKGDKAAKKVEDEGDQKAEDLVNKAKQRADALLK